MDAVAYSIKNGEEDAECVLWESAFILQIEWEVARPKSLTAQECELPLSRNCILVDRPTAWIICGVNNKNELGEF